MEKIASLLKTSTHWIYDVIAIIAGTAMAFAFAPFGIWPLTILSPLALLILSYKSPSTRICAQRFFFFGIGLFSTGVSWVYISIHTFGNTPIWVAGIIVIVFVVALALFLTAQGALFYRFFGKPSTFNTLLMFPTLWALFEWVRTYLLSGFPWLFLGYAHIESPLRGFIPWLGDYGMAFLIVFIAGLFFQCLFAKRKWMSVLGIILIFALGNCAGMLHWSKTVGKPIRVSLLQGNVEQSVKWEPERAQQIINKHVMLTKTQWDHAKLVVWPEQTIPVFKRNAQALLEMLDKNAKKRDMGIIVGIPMADSQTVYYNAAMGLGVASGDYKKRHLVPFGEYVPLEGLLRGLIGFFDLPMSSVTEGPFEQTLVKYKDKPIGIFICYEIAYPHVVLSDLPEAMLLVSISDDTWFGDSIALPQQQQISQFRALEASRFMLLASNSGPTAVINQDGKVIQTIAHNVTGLISADISFESGITPIVWLGANTLIFPLLLLLGFGIRLRYASHPKSGER